MFLLTKNFRTFLGRFILWVCVCVCVYLRWWERPQFPWSWRFRWLLAAWPMRRTLTLASLSEQCFNCKAIFFSLPNWLLFQVPQEWCTFKIFFGNHLSITLNIALYLSGGKAILIWLGLRSFPGHRTENTERRVSGKVGTGYPRVRNTVTGSIVKNPFPCPFYRLRKLRLKGCNDLCKKTHACKWREPDWSVDVLKHSSSSLSYNVEVWLFTAAQVWARNDNPVKYLARKLIYYGLVSLRSCQFAWLTHKERKSSCWKRINYFAVIMNQVRFKPCNSRWSSLLSLEWRVGAGGEGRQHDIY